MTEPRPNAKDAPTSKWETPVVLGNGDTAYIRPLTVDDKSALRAFHEAQSDESVYRRYFSPKPTLSDKELEHFTNVDMIDRVALAVESQNEFVAWASYERWPGRAEAEAAFMVDDEFHGRGIATLLLEHLAAIARSNGIERFTAEVLGDNRGMLAVFAKAGWPLQRRFDSGVVDLDWELATTDEFLDSVERREHRADSRAVARLLLPRSIAVVGASDQEGSVGRALWRHVVDSAEVPVHPVNPRLDDLDGRRCYSSIADLPDDVSLAIIAVPAKALESTVHACIAKRMRGAVVVTDVEGHDVDVTALVATARRNGLRIIGPSSMGVASLRTETALQAAIVNVALPPGRVAVSMQSGALGGSLLRRARDLDLGLSWFVSLGDKSDISANDLLQFWEDDDHTRVIAMYTESFGNPRKFARLARRVSLRRPIVAVRSGSAADGHLGSALYLQAGLIEVPTVTALLDTARVLATQPVLRGPNVAVITNSLSPATMAESALHTAGLTPTTTVSLGWRATGDDFTNAIGTALGDANVDGILVVHAPPVEAHSALIASSITAAAAGATKPVLAVMLGNADGPLSPGSDVPAFTFPEQAAAVLGRSYSYARWVEVEGAADRPAPRPIDPAVAHALITRQLELGNVEPQMLDVESTRDLLTAYSIVMPRAVEATADTVLEAAERVGYPLAVKARRRGVGRSVKAGIALDLTEPADVEIAVAQMTESLGDGASELIVQAMAAPGIDVRIRCEHDDRLGVIVSVGLGGANADVIDDRTSRLAPVSPATAVAMLGETRVRAALDEAGLDDSLLVDAIVLAAQMAGAHAEIGELDLNPVVVSASDAAVTDATVRLVPHDHGDVPLRRVD